MKTRDLVEQLISVLESNRQTGNTTLLLDGARNYDRPFFVLGVNLEYALEKCKGIPNAKPLSIFDLDKARGTSLPIMVDVDVLNWLVGKVAYEFDQMELQLERERIKIDQDTKKYASVANELMNKAETQQKVLINRGELLMKIQTMSWWERIFIAPGLIRQLFLLELNNNQI